MLVRKAQPFCMPITCACSTLWPLMICTNPILPRCNYHRLRCVMCRQAFHDRKIGEPVGHDLPGKVLGLVGMGRVGHCLAASAKALGMTVISTDSSSSRYV